MKTLKISLLAMVFTIGIGGAVVQKIQAAPKHFDLQYNWTKAGSAPFTGTISDAQNNYGCPNLGVGCAHGTEVGHPSVTADIKL